MINHKLTVITHQLDDIGNREWTKAGGDNNGDNLRQAVYEANDLNQYTSRNVPGAVDVLGTATNTATVTANIKAGQRHGEYFRVEVPLDNTNGPVWASIETLGVLKGTSSNNLDVIATNTGHVYVPKTPEAFTYDYDGNLISDGRWTNTWDGENRVIHRDAAH